MQIVVHTRYELRTLRFAWYSYINQIFSWQTAT
jgi:hypothetical protein